MIFWLLIGIALYCLYRLSQLLRGPSPNQKGGGSKEQVVNENSQQNAQPAVATETDDKKMKCQLEFTIGETSIGKVTVELFDDTPRTSNNFYQLCKTGEYNNVPVHRIVPQFMIQTGDITNGNGTGGKSIYGEKFADENFNHKHNRPGLLSMANAGPNTNSSQFFITTEPAPWLDNKHVVFGQVIKGMKVVKLIEKVRCQGDTPVEDVRIKKANVTYQDKVH